MDISRYAAACAVVKLHEGGYANLVAKHMLEGAKLDERQKAFATALFYGTAERLVTLDALLRPYLGKRPLHKLDTEVRAVLETGLYQMLYMQVPARAAVDEAVKLARAFKKSSAAGLVNAVLRKAQNADIESLSFDNETQRVAAVWSVSEAVATAVMQAMPGSYDDFFAASFQKKELCLRANTLKTSAEALAAALREKGAAVRAGALPNCLYMQRAGGVDGEALFAEGYYHVQGEASQFACACVGAAGGEKVLDLCAAPGGKTATLAQEMGGGAGLVACDVRENRRPLIEATLQRLGIAGVRVLLNDAANYNAAFAGQDAVLCDVPCSGLGVLAKKPDLRYTRGGNFAALPALQMKVLASAARYMGSGGRLIYSTCTVRREENQSVVREFLASHTDFKLNLPKNIPPGALVEDGMVTILPQFTGLDGFFVATLERL